MNAADPELQQEPQVFEPRVKFRQFLHKVCPEGFARIERAVGGTRERVGGNRRVHVGH